MECMCHVNVKVLVTEKYFIDHESLDNATLFTPSFRRRDLAYNVFSSSQSRYILSVLNWCLTYVSNLMSRYMYTMHILHIINHEPHH